MFTFKELPTDNMESASLVDAVKELLAKIGDADILRAFALCQRVDSDVNSLIKRIDGLQPTPPFSVIQHIFPTSFRYRTMAIERYLAKHCATIEEFVRDIVAGETEWHNAYFFKLLKESEEGIPVYHEGIDDGCDFPPRTAFLPERCVVKTGDHIVDDDLKSIRDRLVDNIESGDVIYPTENATLICSPLTSTASGLTEKIASEAGLKIRVQGRVPDNEAYVVIPSVTIDCFDWGTFTHMAPDDPREPDDRIVFQRIHKLQLVISKPLAFIKIKIGAK